ncbi:carbonic anhydrase family protein [Streptomonospora nanhaiensis]|uniref:carbonic anhydrase n=1 Tax=Streptomonospora nanhaiensis TaxID=1323731 RepID=A0A853BHG2_9ACTN|nr:carbonic anhydrase family protein [Streptomonospora nanhaiensis]MBV2362519.1 carbonic anhydrase family protein [Streptomonospora nanhaiensis]MBX9389319.1 carbonic anhydrase family protein [Streptomonospora nanhaiensis]NYI94819.1 carbonic anhydrase [Streptomonospora nanhaiensis]
MSDATVPGPGAAAPGPFPPAHPRPWGQEQSPVNVRTDRLVPTAPLDLRFDYAAEDVEFRYTRYAADQPPGLEYRAVEENVPGTVVGEGSRLRCQGREYVLTEIHWHTPSEHLVDGRSYWLEQHLKHHPVDDRGAALVVAVFWAAGPANPDLDRVFGALPRGRDATAVTRVGAVRLDRLVPEATESYGYIGSLTTGAYTEGVRWVLLSTPMTASADTLAAFEGLFPAGNARRVQRLHGRRVTLSPH